MVPTGCDHALGANGTSKPRAMSAIADRTRKCAGMTWFLKGMASHFRGQIERDDGKRNQNNQPQDIGDDERQHTVEDGRYLHVLHDALDHEDVHADRRMDEAELDRHDDDDAEPDGIESELFDDG